MKARIPVKLKKEAMAEINRLADREYQKVKDKEIADATRRIFKMIVFALYKDFGFGRDRCAKALKSMTEIIEHSDTDEVFWEHIDRVVIDKLKLNLTNGTIPTTEKLLILKETKKMRKYEAVYSSDVLDEIKSGKDIFLLNRATNNVSWVNGMTVGSLVKVFKHDNKDNIYEFYKEVKANDKL